MIIPGDVSEPAADPDTIAKPVAPVAYLHPPPTDEEQELANQLRLHNGAAVPFWMFARFALLLHDFWGWASRNDRFWRRLRRYVIAGVAAAGTSIGTLTVNWLHVHDARVAEEERAAAGERAFQVYRETTAKEIAELRLDVRELRAELHRITGADQGPVSGISAYVDSGVAAIRAP